MLLTGAGTGTAAYGHSTCILTPDLYREIATRRDTRRLGELASVGIGYVSGANQFFHLRPSEADKFDIPPSFLLASVRNGRALPSSRLTTGIVERWKRDDEPVLLLKISKTQEVPRSVRRYLETDAARVARMAYKCRVRDPWYSVPDVQVPDFFSLTCPAWNRTSGAMIRIVSRG
jgi:hypothetical protein